jgi:hypothetical protein
MPPLRASIAALLTTFALCACGRGQSSYSRGDPGERRGSTPAAPYTAITAPSSGTSNGTEQAVSQR